MARGQPELTEEQWAKLRPLLPELKPGPYGGRPWADNRKTLEGILWLLRSGARWKDIPSQFASPATCWRRLRKWQAEGVWENAWRTLLAELDELEKLNWDEAFIDATFFQAKKGAMRSGPHAKGKARSSWSSSMGKARLSAP